MSKNADIKGTIEIQTFKIDIHNKTVVFFCLFFTPWYLKFKFFQNTFWTKISKSGHKGQLISKGLFSVNVWTEKPTKLF